MTMTYKQQLIQTLFSIMANAGDYKNNLLAQYEFSMVYHELIQNVKQELFDERTPKIDGFQYKTSDAPKLGTEHKSKLGFDKKDNPYLTSKSMTDFKFRKKAQEQALKNNRAYSDSKKSKVSLLGDVINPVKEKVAF